MNNKIIKRLTLMIVLVFSLSSYQYTLAYPELGYQINVNTTDPAMQNAIDKFKEANNWTITVADALSYLNSWKLPTDIHYWNFTPLSWWGWNVTCNNGADLMDIVPRPTPWVCDSGSTWPFTSTEMAAAWLCYVGYPTTVRETPTGFVWSCVWLHRWPSDYCSASKKSDWLCWAQSWPYQPTQFTPLNKCDVWTPNSESIIGTSATWDCEWPNGWTIVACSAQIEDDSCWYIAWQSLTTTQWLAAAGLPWAMCTFWSPTGISGGWTWNCWIIACSATEITNSCSNLIQDGSETWIDCWWVCPACSWSIPVPTPITCDDTYPTDTVPLLGSSDGCKSRVYWYSDAWWSDCVQGGWDWLKTNCEQHKNFNNLSMNCWNNIPATYTSTGVLIDAAYCNNTWCPSAPSHPSLNPLYLCEQNINLTVSSLASSTCGNMLADNSSSCSVMIWISHTWPIIQENIAWAWQSFWGHNVYNTHQWNNVLASSPGDFNYNVNNTQISFNWIRSFAPFAANANLDFSLGWKNISLPISYLFKKPYTWNLATANAGQLPSIWTNIEYIISTIWSIGGISPNLVTWDISVTWPHINDLAIQDKTSLWGGRFSARINTDSNELVSVLETGLGIAVSPNVSYNLWWYNVQYALTNSNMPTDNSPLSLAAGSFLWVKIIWSLQWDWKQNLTGQEDNFSDLSKYENRKVIKEIAYNLIKWREPRYFNHPPEYINGVRYVSWDISISWDQAYETLVVIDWSVTIIWDLNPSWNKFWIIVLKDWYSVENDFSSLWNIFINSNVKFIDAMIYADGWLISTNSLWSIYDSDSVSRTSDLQEQLVLKWSIFTRNTIGWAILSGTNYILPGWKNLSNSDLDFNKAMMYDLNYIRRWNNWSTSIPQSIHNWWNTTNPFVIVEKPENKLNPPKWFSK